MFMGCTDPEIIENQTTSGAFVIFMDPQDTSTQLLIDRAEILTGQQVESKCVDLSKLQTGTASDSEATCLLNNPTYEDDMQTLEGLLSQGYQTTLYYYDNQSYQPVALSLNPSMIASSLCNYSNCEVEHNKVDVTIYIVNEDDKNELILLDNLQSAGLLMNYNYVTINDITDLSGYDVANAPIIVINKDDIDVDNEFIVDYVFPSLVNPSYYSQTGWKFEDMGDAYVGEKYNLIDSDHYLGDLIKLNAKYYVKSMDEESYLSYMLNYGIDLNSETILYDDNVTLNVDAEYLPVLVFDNITTEQKEDLLTRIKSPFEAYENNGAVVVELASPDLQNYIGEGYDNVTLDMFIMSECPYGLQMQKAIIPVAKLLDGVNGVQINNLFVDYVMHGQPEADYNLIQYCVAENTDLIWDYLECFVQARDKADVCLAELSIDKAMIDQCVNETTTQYNIQGTSFPIFAQENEEHGITGSPGVVFNGKKVNMNRNAEYIKNVICAHMKDKPDECNTDLSGFGNAATSYGPIISSGTGSTTATCG